MKPLIIITSSVYNPTQLCLTETFLNSSIPRDDNRITIDGYNLKRSDDPSGSEKAEVCIYYKEHIPLIFLDDIKNTGELNILAV